MNNLACAFGRHFGEILSAFFVEDISISGRKRRKPLKKQGFAHSRTNRNAYLRFERSALVGCGEIFYRVKYLLRADLKEGNMITAQETFDGEIIVDNFAGGGGASTGIEIATGRLVALAINRALQPELSVEELTMLVN